MLTREELGRSPLFQDISYEEYAAMCQCFQASSRSYRPEEVICDFSEGCDSVGIVERGRAALIRIDENGVATVLEDLEGGSVFGRTLTFSGGCSDTLEVVSRSACEVSFIDYAHILKRCQNACTHHSVLVQNMLSLMEDKARALSRRVDVLSRRSIREKLLCYFGQRREEAGGDRFRLPFSLSVLADYIATDRSAMMRELKKMREEGLVQTDGREILLFLKEK